MRLVFVLVGIRGTERGHWWEEKCQPKNILNGCEGPKDESEEVK